MIYNDPLPRRVRWIAAVPSQSGTLTYNGSAQSPAWSNYDPNAMTLGGTASGTNAGSYTAVFTPKPGYTWADGSTEAKSVGWTIGKAAGSVSVSPGSLSLDSDSPTKTITVTRSGTGAITATSSDTGVATVSISGNKVTVTGHGAGRATITIKVASDANHFAAQKTVKATMTISAATLTITGNGIGEGGTQVYVEIGGKQYDSPATISVPYGSSVYCFARGQSGADFSKGTIYLNDVRVASSKNGEYAKYTYTPSSPSVKVVLTVTGYIHEFQVDSGTIKITET